MTFCNKARKRGFPVILEIHPVHCCERRGPVSNRSARTAGHDLLVVGLVGLCCVLAGCAAAQPPAPAPSGPVNTPDIAYRSYLRVYNASMNAPLAQDWSGPFAEQAVEPALASGVDAWRRLRDAGVTVGGGIEIVSLTPVSQDATTAVVQSCESVAGRTATQNGRPLTQRPGAVTRYRVTVTTRLDGTAWKVAEIADGGGSC